MKRTITLFISAVVVASMLVAGLVFRSANAATTSTNETLSIARKGHRHDRHVLAPLPLTPTRSFGPSTGSGTFKSVDFPGALSTAVMSIFSTVVAGYYVDAENTYHGFWGYWQSGSFGSFTVGSSYTILTGINDDLILVGDFDNAPGDGSGCLNPGAGSCHAFTKYPDDPVREIPYYSGATSMTALGTNSSVFGIAGAYTNVDTTVHGFLLGLSQLPDPPDAALAFATGVNDQWDQVVGRVDTTDGVTHGYLAKTFPWPPVYTLIDVPNAVSTVAWGIGSNGGPIVGEYTDDKGTTHGFLLNNQVFETIDVPDAISTTCHGISGLAGPCLPPQCNVAGSYVDSNGVMHGFVWTP